MNTIIIPSHEYIYEHESIFIEISVFKISRSHPIKSLRKAQEYDKNPMKKPSFFHPIAWFSTLYIGRCTRLPERRRTRTSDVGQQRWLQGGKTPVDDGESLIGYPLVICQNSY